jgi:hypothetical protein
MIKPGHSTFYGATHGRAHSVGEGGPFTAPESVIEVILDAVAKPGGVIEPSRVATRTA